MIDRIRREPALVAALIQAVIGALVAFGVPVTEPQKVALLGLWSALAPIVCGVVVRSQVTPVRSEV